MNANRSAARFAPVISVLLAACSSLVAAPTPVKKPALRSVSIARNIDSGNILYLQLDIAKALHYFEDEGLTPKFRYIRGATAVSEAVLNGEDEFSGNSIDHTMTAQSGAHHLEMVASFTSLPAVSVLVQRPLRTSIRSVADLKGHRIGISGLGAGTYVIAHAILESAGLRPDAVEFVPLGVGKPLFEGMRNGEVDAVITTDPIAIHLLVDANCSLLLDLVTPEEAQRVFHGGYQFTGLLTRSDTIEKNPELVQKMVNITVRATRYIATHSASEIGSILPPEVVGDRFLFIKSVEHSRPSFSKDGNVHAEDVANSIKAFEHSSGKHVSLTVFEDRFARLSTSR